MRPRGVLTHHAHPPRKPDTVGGKPVPDGVLVEICERDASGSVPVVVYGPPEFLVEIFAMNEAVEIRVGPATYRAVIYRVSLRGSAIAGPCATGWIE